MDMDAVESAERDAGGVRFAGDARLALREADAASRGLHHVYLGTEHLVLALARESAAGRLERLGGLGGDWRRAEALVGEIVVPGAPEAPGAVRPTPPPVLPHTSRLKQVFALAGAGARELGQEEVGAVHLLLGLVRERGGIGAHVLRDVGLTEDAVLAVARNPDAAAG